MNCFKTGFETHCHTCDTCFDPSRDFANGLLCSLEDARRAALLRTPATPTTFPTRASSKSFGSASASDADLSCSTALSMGDGRSIVKTPHVAPSSTKINDSIGSASDSTCHFVPLPVMLFNPALTVNQLEIARRLLRMAGVAGYVRDSEPANRLWVFMMCDLGAIPAEGTRPNCIHAVMALGHEEQTVVKTDCALVFATAMDDLSQFFPSFRSEAGRTAFREAWDNHKAMQALKLLSRVICRVFAAECFVALQREPTVEEFETWLRSHPHDQKFTLLAELFALDAMTSLFALRSGMRSNNARRIGAARKSYVHRLAGRGKFKYAPAMVRDICCLEWQSTPEVRAIVEFWRTYKGQGLDWKLEEYNADIKAHLVSDTPEGWLMAGLTSSKSRDRFNDAFSSYGIPAPSPVAEPQSREDPALPTIEADVMSALLNARALRPTPPSEPRGPCTILKDTPLLHTYSDIIDSGKNAVANFITELQRVHGTHVESRITFPSALVAMTQDEERARDATSKVVKSIRKYGVNSIRLALDVLEQEGVADVDAADDIAIEA